MKRFALLLALTLGSLTFYAQEQMPQGTKDMSGTICDSKCVTQNAGQSACDAKCTQTSGEAVFIDDSGKVTKIANPEKVKDQMGKHVKAKCKMMKTDQGQSAMFIYQIVG